MMEGHDVKVFASWNNGRDEVMISPPQSQMRNVDQQEEHLYASCSALRSAGMLV